MRRLYLSFCAVGFCILGADPGFLKRGGGSILGLQAKKGVPGGGPTLGPMLNSLYRGPQKGGGRPPTPRVRSCILCPPNNFDESSPPMQKK